MISRRQALTGAGAAVAAAALPIPSAMWPQVQRAVEIDISMIPAVSHLDRFAYIYGTVRKPCENDDQLRERVLEVIRL